METSLAETFKVLLPHMDERQKRLLYAAGARAIGRAGISLVSRLTGASRNTITKGLKEFDEELGASKGDSELLQVINDKVADKPGRCRKKGGGRKLIEQKHPEILGLIKDIIEPHVSGSPVKSITWISKSTRHIADELKNTYDIDISYKKVGRILKKEGYSLQANKKSKTTTKKS
jgi:hypothetical protein